MRRRARLRARAPVVVPALTAWLAGPARLQVGPSKRAKCEKMGVPLVGEDFIFGLVAKSLR